MTSCIETFTGECFQPLSPILETIWLEDIAHALSNQCRFSGHVREHYSVAEHSVRVSLLLAEWGEDEDVQLWGLMHDASEAYLVDLPTPLKDDPAIGDGYRAAERALMRAICMRFGLPETQPDPVRVADAVLLATETRDLMPCRPAHWKNLVTVKALAERISPWSPRRAERQFLKRFRKLDVKRR